MYVLFECCVLSCGGRCDGLITHPEESYRVWCFSLSVIVKLRTVKLRTVKLSPGIGLRRHGEKQCEI